MTMLPMYGSIGTKVVHVLGIKDLGLSEYVTYV